MRRDWFEIAVVSLLVLAAGVIVATACLRSAEGAPVGPEVSGTCRHWAAWPPMDGWGQVEVRHREMEATVGNMRNLGCEVLSAGAYGETAMGEPCYLIVWREPTSGGLCE